MFLTNGEFENVLSFLNVADDATLKQTCKGARDHPMFRYRMFKEVSPYFPKVAQHHKRLDVLFKKKTLFELGKLSFPKQFARNREYVLHALDTSIISIRDVPNNLLEDNKIIETASFPSVEPEPFHHTEHNSARTLVFHYTHYHPIWNDTAFVLRCILNIKFMLKILHTYRNAVVRTLRLDDYKDTLLELHTLNYKFFPNLTSEDHVKLFANDPLALLDIPRHERLELPDVVFVAAYTANKRVFEVMPRHLGAEVHSVCEEAVMFNPHNIAYSAVEDIHAPVEAVVEIFKHEHIYHIGKLHNDSVVAALPQLIDVFKQRRFAKQFMKSFLRRHLDHIKNNRDYCKLIATFLPNKFRKTAFLHDDELAQIAIGKQGSLLRFREFAKYRLNEGVVRNAVLSYISALDFLPHLKRDVDLMAILIRKRIHNFRLADDLVKQQLIELVLQQCTKLPLRYDGHGNYVRQKVGWVFACDKQHIRDYFMKDFEKTKEWLEKMPELAVYAPVSLYTDWLEFSRQQNVVTIPECCLTEKIIEEVLLVEPIKYTDLPHRWRCEERWIGMLRSIGKPHLVHWVPRDFRHLFYI